MKKKSPEGKRRNFGALTIPELKATIFKEGKEIAEWPAWKNVRQEQQLALVGRDIEITKVEVQRGTAKIKSRGGKPPVIAFSQGMQAGLGYASKVVHGARRGGKLIDHQGRVHKQRRGSVI